ncbi:hypothetical protein ILUMI_10920 [Ignelater luminosus]|uniref:F-box domain-containing protein n=1 Tax=Ignelater luminosus TaxID=2038154 RepID=A0A8K0CX83_IGNLU|nr:hypothetical protein ILUMI_10920 [Ignelater luminosus]
MTTLPVEIIERILYYCDGKTLLNAKYVDETWKNIVEFLTQKTQIWKWCCFEEIPQNELVNYSEKYENYNDEDKWLNIYNTWYSWQNIKENVQFATFLCPAEIPRITYVAVSGNYIAVGSEDGRVKIYEKSWGLLHTARYQAVRITEITFMSDDEKGDSDSDHVYILLAYKTGTLVLTEFDGKLNELDVIQDVKLHSVYKKYLCYERRGGRITISKLCRHHPERNQIFCEITFLRIYSPNEVSCLHMWGGVATFLINNEVKVLKYDQNIAPVSSVENKVKIKFCLKNHPRLERSCHIYRDDIIICASTSSDMEQFLELFILGEKDQYSKKLFNSWEVLQANITCMFLYGSVFILGDDIGNIYFYHVPSWKTFNIRDYQKKIIIGRHPIIGIDVKENREHRTFFVTSSFNIHEVIALTPLII